MKSNFLRKIFGSPLRLFGFIAALLAIYFGLLSIDGYRSNYFLFICGSFSFSSVILYVLAYKINDLQSDQPSVLRLFGSPIKFIAFLSILYGVNILALQLVWIHVTLSHVLFPLLGGICLYWVDRIIKKEKHGSKMYFAFQFFIVISVLVGITLFFVRAKGATTIVFPKNTQNEAIIVYGIEGYPSLPPSYFWNKTIHLPEDGLLITSTLLEELPGYRRNYLDEDGNTLEMNQLFVQEVCGPDDILIIAQYFTPRSYYPYIPFDQTDLQRDYQKVYDSICSGKLKSKYVDTRLKKYRKEKPRDQLFHEFQ